jgi:hypothetical protein
MVSHLCYFGASDKLTEAKRAKISLPLNQPSSFSIAVTILCVGSTFHRWATLLSWLLD